MNYMDWCVKNKLDTNTSSLELWKKSPEFKEKWSEWIARHGDSDESWKLFNYEQWILLTGRDQQ